MGGQRFDKRTGAMRAARAARRTTLRDRGTHGRGDSALMNCRELSEPYYPSSGMVVSRGVGRSPQIFDILS